MDPTILGIVLLGGAMAGLGFLVRELLGPRGYWGS